MKKLFTLLFFVLILGACTKPSDPGASLALGEQTTITGLLLMQGNTPYIQNKDGDLIELETLTVNFISYNGQNVTVQGEFKGDKLHVEQIGLLNQQNAETNPQQ